LQTEHQSDGDGGYALIDAVKRAGEEIPAETRGLYVSALGDLVRGAEPALWSIALEALVQLGEREEVAALGVAALTDGDDDRKDYVVHALLRTGQVQFHDAIVEHIRRSLRHRRHLTIPILAALCRMDREACLQMSAAFFERAYAAVQTNEVEGFIQVFAAKFTGVEDTLLPELVRRVSSPRPDAGRWLAACFADYLSKPWMVRRLGNDRVRRLGDELLGRSGPVN
jgi:hypothetical protein